MIDPLACALQITEDDPLLAEPLIDFLLWATRDGDTRKTAEYDQVVEVLHSKTRHAIQQREDYLASREAEETASLVPN